MFSLAQTISTFEAKLQNEEFFKITISDAYGLRQDHSCVNKKGLGEIFANLDRNLQENGVRVRLFDLDVDWVANGEKQKVSFYLSKLGDEYRALDWDKMRDVVNDCTCFSDLAGTMWQDEREISTAVSDMKKELTEKIATLKTLAALRLESTSLFSSLPLDVLQFCIAPHLV